MTFLEAHHFQGLERRYLIEVKEQKNRIRNGFGRTLSLMKPLFSHEIDTNQKDSSLFVYWRNVGYEVFSWMSKQNTIRRDVHKILF